MTSLVRLHFSLLPSQNCCSCRHRCLPPHLLSLLPAGAAPEGHPKILSLSGSGSSLFGALRSRSPRVSVTGGGGATFAEENAEQEEREVEVLVVGGSSYEEEDLGRDGEVFKRTLRLVECSMFASISGLAYLLSNSLAIENYLGCFFALPIVISSMRWGLAAGRKTMVATAMLLLTLSGPVKASTYLLLHGFVGLTMGSLWRLQTNWALSIILSSLVRGMGAVGYVLISSFLIRENIFALITVNIHATLTYMFAAIGINIVPTMDAVYSLFGILLLLNCVFLVFLLHILYAVFLAKLGMKASLRLPGWLDKAI